ncbi:hypothetical protein MZUP3_590 [Erwinia phage vB_EhrS_49]|uniref:Uncharacterized protein n=1 Tax=Erwinia phage vB_EhrS_49 TaxID=2283026 RepID=A0A4Y1NR56_9CAUD|nr:hypothetical protein HOV54_gp59 [Erwinia phage vB_EhrS_49]AXH43469.1 hypothetical protein MZUP3_590 [Erwinia phage vB_EhrS_49]
MEVREKFRNEIAAICIKRFSMSSDSLPVVSSWRDWDDLFDAGYRIDTIGEAFQEWLSFT